MHYNWKYCQIVESYVEKNATVHFKRLGSRNIHKETEIPYCVFGIKDIICKTGLKVTAINPSVTKSLTTVKYMYV